ncbi:MAG: hypothetical protein JSS49_09190 [Planctomycetes bacterium]|nr:hypothetical protein [Planctomycetota bacterium]
MSTGVAVVWVSSAQGQGDSSQTTPPKTPGTKTPDPAKIKAATDFMKRVHDGLYDRSSIRADIEQTVSIGAQKFQVTGQYVNAGQRLRLEYTIQPDQGVSGSLLEVSNGKELWSQMKVGETKRVTHRDIEQIKAAVTSTKSVPDVVLTAELGLGGLTALMASLERTMVFDAMKEESVDEGGRTIVQGRWKPEVAKRWPTSKDGLLPVYVPDMARIWVDTKTMFPVRIVYIKRAIEKDKKVYRPMVSLRFSNVQFDAPVNDQEFEFVNTDKTVPEDITRQFLDRMKQSAGEDAAKPGTELTTPKK